MSPQPSDVIPDDLILAAIERAELHSRDDDAGVLYATVVDHLGLSKSSATGRKLRPRFREMEATGLIAQLKRHSLTLYTATRKGKRALKSAGGVELPESPQHRAWREAKATAAERIQGFREDFQALLCDSAILLADDATDSEAWFALGERLDWACSCLGSATHCLREWQEPSDDARDADSAPRAGRRLTRSWDLLA
jgi:hypothetical protein